MAKNGTYTPVTENFTMVDNNITLNTSISPEARFIYTIIQTQITNKNFTIYKETIFHIFGKSRQCFDKYWNELKKLGLLIIRKVRDAKNRFHYDYELVPLDKARPESDTQPTLKKNLNDTEDKSTPFSKDKGHHNAIHSANAHPSTQKEIGNYDLTLFQQTWLDVTKKPILLSDAQKCALNYLIKKYTYQSVICAVQKIKESQYLMQNITVMYFIKCFEKIFSDTYKDRIQVTNTLNYSNNNYNQTYNGTQTRFNTLLDKREWDFEELDRLEQEYISKKLEKLPPLK